MNLEKSLQARSQGHCELCNSDAPELAYEVAHAPGAGEDAHVWICSACHGQLQGEQPMDAVHWRCLNDSMWSTVPAVQVLAWRTLHQLKDEGWPLALIEMLYLDEETLAWAKAGLPPSPEDLVAHLDSNGQVLQAGDTVVLIKDLKVKGANFTAKRGTAVRRIGLVPDNPGQIEGRVEGQQIVILTEFVKKSK